MNDSPFNIDHQNNALDAQITAALERIGESLRLLLANEARGYGLSAIQAKTLIFLLSHAEDKGTLSYLAKEFNLTKATLSDVVKVLVEKKLVQKKDSPSDSRSQILKLTTAGRRIATQCSQFANGLTQSVKAFSTNRKLVLKESLFNLVHDLYQNGIITVQRMCYNCTYFDDSNKVPFCDLLKIKLTTEKLRLDCPEFENKTGAISEE